MYLYQPNIDPDQRNPQVTQEIEICYRERKIVMDFHISYGKDARLAE